MAQYEKHRKTLVYSAVIFFGLFVALLFYGYYAGDARILGALNVLKYLFVLLLAFSIFDYYHSRDRNVLLLLALSLLALWLGAPGFAYRWDESNSVTRAQHYMAYDFFSNTERRSLMYYVWGIAYAVFGQSEALTHLINIAISLAGLYALHKLAKDLYGDFAGMVALVAGMTMPALLIVGRWAYLDPSLVAAVIVTFYLFFRYLKTGRRNYLYATYAATFLAIFLKVEPALVIFPILFVGMVLYKKAGWKDLALLGVLTVAGTTLVLYLMTPIQVMDSILTANKQFTIITPLEYGADALLIWSGLLVKQLEQLIFSGMIIFASLAFFKISGKGRYATYLALASQALLLVVGASFLQFDYFNVLSPLNLRPQLYVLALFCAGILALLALRRIKLEAGRDEIILLTWIAGFMLFFMINAHMVGHAVANKFDAASFDFRYIMPALPALILLFSSGVSKAFQAVDLKRARYALALIVAAVILFNCIVSMNYIFMYGTSGNAFAEGYKKAAEGHPDVIYTHWPFHLDNPLLTYDIGAFRWTSDDITAEENVRISQVANTAFLMADKHPSNIYNRSRLLNIDFQYVQGGSYMLDPVFTGMKYKVNTKVYYARSPQFPSIAYSGFYGPNEGEPRWMTNNTTALIYSDNATRADLSLSMVSPTEGRHLMVYVNGALAYEGVLGTERVSVTVPMDLVPGKNTVVFYSPEEEVVRGQVTGWLGKYDRYAGFGYYGNFTVTQGV